MSASEPIPASVQAERVETPEWARVPYAGSTAYTMVAGTAIERDLPPGGKFSHLERVDFDANGTMTAEVAAEFWHRRYYESLSAITKLDGSNYRNESRIREWARGEIRRWRLRACVGWGLAWLLLLLAVAR